MSTTIASLAVPTLDRAAEMLRDGEVHEGMTHLSLMLRELRTELDGSSWEQWCHTTASSHPLRDLLHQDPFTRHSFLKPRGYPGDAELLDFIYGHLAPAGDTTDLGSEIFRYTTNTGAPHSVRARRDLLSELIDSTAERFAQPELLSVACGHLREAEGSRALAEERIGQFIALDHDARSLAKVSGRHAERPVRTVQASVRDLLTGRVRFERLHLIYAAGLYDYLSVRAGTRLSSILFDALASGGRLLVANFTPYLRDIGYMEAFMDWRLTFRGAAQLEALLAEIPPRQVAQQSLYWDPHGNIAFAELTRA